MIYTGDSLEILKTLESESVNCCVTSPPYYGLRDYGVDGQIGQEQTPTEYINRLVEVFGEIKRVLKNDGTLWVNIADTYCSTAPGTIGDPYFIKESKQEINEARRRYRGKTPKGMKPKDLMGIPWMLAFALRADGWYLRQDIIWQKPNPMPESVKDRCTKSHEYIFLLSKSKKYYYDNEAIKEPRVGSNDYSPAGSKGDLRPNSRLRGSGNKERKQRPGAEILQKGAQAGSVPYDSGNLFRNKRDVWTVAPKPYKEAHFATFPTELIEPCVLAGCPVGGTVIDPFFGSGTTGVVAKENNRNYIGIELNPMYVEMAKRRISEVVQ